jgi:hypothetical protein
MFAQTKEMIDRSAAESKYEYNKEVITVAPVKLSINKTNRRFKDEADVVKMYMEYFDQVIEEQILANNENLYISMTKFLRTSSEKLNRAGAMVHESKSSIIDHAAFNVKKESASQIPTCLVITSSESASSIETQFETVATQLNRSINSVNIVLDEKKCGNMKQAIEFIQEKLRTAFDLNREDTKNRQSHH